jgi:hypothetical protein
MHLHNCRCFLAPLGILLQRLRAHCLAPGGPERIKNYLGALVRTTGVSGSCACGFRTDFHFADAALVGLEHLVEEHGASVMLHSVLHVHIHIDQDTY